MLLPESLVEAVNKTHRNEDDEPSELIHVDANKGLMCSERMELRQKAELMKQFSRTQETSGYGKGKGKGRKCKIKHGPITDIDLSLDLESDRRSFTPVGTATRPFRTVADGVNLLSFSETNCNLNPATIKVAPGVYAEDIRLEDDNLSYLSISGPTKYIGMDAQLDGKVISKSNNDSFKKLLIEGLTINDGIEIEGASDETNAFSVDLVFHTCLIKGPISIKNVKVAVFVDCKILADIYVENVSLFAQRGVPGTTGKLTLIYDGSKKKSGTYTYAILDNTILYGGFVAERVGSTGSVIVQPRKGSRLGLPGRTTQMGVGCSLTGYGFTLLGNFVNDGGTVNCTGDFFDKTGTDLSSNNIQGALKELYTRVKALEG